MKQRHILIIASILALAAAASFALRRAGAAQDAPAATETWSGGDANDNNWTSNDNWAGVGGAGPDDDLVFPQNAARKSNVNDFPINTRFNSLTFSGAGYVVTGNQIFLRNGITTDYADTAGAGPVFIPNIILDESMTINTVTERTLTLNGAVSGSGGLTKNGPGALILSHNNTYTGLTSINAGTVGISADRRVRLSFAS